MSRWLEKLLAECLAQTSTARLWPRHTCARTSYLSSSRAWLSNNVCVNPVLWVNICMWRKLLFFLRNAHRMHPCQQSWNWRLLLMVYEGSHIKRCFSSGPLPGALLTSICSNFVWGMHERANAFQPEWVLHAIIMWGICSPICTSELVGPQTCLSYVGMEWCGWGGGVALSPAGGVLFSRPMTCKSSEPQNPTYDKKRAFCAIISKTYTWIFSVSRLICISKSKSKIFAYLEVMYCS